MRIALTLLLLVPLCAHADPADHYVSLRTSEGPAGSGVILPDGKILTASHVVGELKQLTARRDFIHSSLEIPCKLIKIDREADLALLKLEALFDLKPAYLGQAPRAGQHLQWCADFLLGDGLPAIKRRWQDGKVAGDWQDKFLAINGVALPGYSGCGIYDDEGRLVSIMLATCKDAGVALAAKPTNLQKFLK